MFKSQVNIKIWFSCAAREGGNVYFTRRQGLTSCRDFISGQANPSTTLFSQLTCTTTASAHHQSARNDESSMDTTSQSTVTKSQQPMDTSSASISSITPGSQSQHIKNSRRLSKDTLNPTTVGDMEHQPPSVGGTTAPLSVGESELSGDSGHVDIDSLPRSNNSLLNTCK